MEYSAQITRANPTCLIFLIDQSGSMSEPFGMQPDKKKSEGVAEIINNILYNLVITCNRSAGIHDFLHLGIIGYGAAVASAFAGGLAGEKLVTITKLANNSLRIQDHTTKVKDPTGQEVTKTVKRPIWIEPSADGHTPLAEALTMAGAWITDFITQFPDCFPPLVINLTDGRPSNPDPRPHAKALKELRSSDGRVLLFNVHISKEPATPIEFPSREDALPKVDERTDKFTRFLFQLSSVFPHKFVEMGRAAGLDVDEQSRGFVFNADFGSLQKFLDFGTKTQQATLR